jgi:hypothetical protein
VRWRELVIALVLCVSVAEERAAAQKLASWRELPHGACRFAVDNFQFTPDPWQEETLIAFGNPAIQRISLQACAGPGKTAIEAVCGWYFLATQVSIDGGGYEHPKGFATSITGDNLRDNLWAEFAKWQARSEYLRTAFTWSANRIFQNSNPATWFLAARNWPKSGSADEQGRTFSGLHGKNVLALADESGAIPPTILRAIEQALPNTHFGKALQAGNPISLEGMLYEAATRLRHLWHIIRVTGDPDDPKAWVNSPRVATVAPGQQSPADWAREQIATYTRENPWVMAYILGQFPPASINALLTLEEVELAMKRELAPGDYDWQQKRLGVDVARFGDDRSVIFARQGANARVKNSPIILRGADTAQIAARVWQAKSKWRSELELIDDTGHWGHGTIDQLRVAGTAPHAVVFSAKAINPRYKNRRAEMWIEMAKEVKRTVALPDRCPELVAELITPTYTFLNGQLVLEEKDQVKKRLGRSPDLADALALTYALPDMPADVLRQITGHQQQQGRVDTDFDPFGGQS